MFVYLRLLVPILSAIKLVDSIANKEAIFSTKV